MTAEAGDLGADLNTKRPAGMEMWLQEFGQIHRLAQKTVTKKGLTQTCGQHNTVHVDTHRCRCEYTHTHKTYTVCLWRKAIYWPTAEVSASKVNLRRCLMCSASFLLSLSISVSLALSPRLRETHLLYKSKYTSRVGKCIHTTGDLITGAVNWAMRTSSTLNDIQTHIHGVKGKM